MKIITRILLSALAALLAVAVMFGAVMFVAWGKSPGDWEEIGRYTCVVLLVASGVATFSLVWDASKK